MSQTPPTPQAAPEATKKRSSVAIRGLTGTLNHDDVNQAMETRGGALVECIDRGRRRIRWVSGEIHFRFKVDGTGKATDVRAVHSDLGHLELERCLTGVLAQTPFPVPAGRALTKDLSWSMNVDPAYREPEPMDPARLDKLLTKKSKDAYEACELRRKRRNRFQVTAYVNPRGRITSLSAIQAKGRNVKQVEPETLECLLGEIKAWRLPKPKRRSKVSFELR